MSFGRNRATWNAFKQHFLTHFANKEASDITVDIYSGASPEGPAAHNHWLAGSRGNAIRDLIRNEYGNRIGNIYVHNQATTWDDFYEVIAATKEPWRNQVLNILKQPASQDTKKIDHRERQLRQLYGGRLWNILLNKYLPALRSGTSAVIRLESERDTVYIKPATVPVPVYVKPQRDTIVISHRDTVYIHETIVNNIYHYGDSGKASPFDQQRALKQARKDSLNKEWLQYPAWALKTNLLMWGIVTPNIEIELPLGRNNRWSLEIEYFITWFTWSQNAHASQFHNLGLELRHYLGNRKKHRWLQGWHIGLAAACGYYDCEWKKHEGYQGEYINGYLNIGYQHRWGRHWALDFGVGVGAMFTKYRHYYGSSVYPENHLTEKDDLLIWHDSDHYLWLGPCHANISLVYMFNAWPFHTKSKKLNDKR